MTINYEHGKLLYNINLHCLGTCRAEEVQTQNNPNPNPNPNPHPNPNPKTEYY